MSTAEYNIISKFLQETIENKKDENPLANVLTKVFNEAMKIERQRAINASDYERTDKRNGQSNGYKNITLKTRVGDITLDLPQVRNKEGWSLRFASLLALATWEGFILQF